MHATRAQQSCARTRTGACAPTHAHPRLAHALQASGSTSPPICTCTCPHPTSHMHMSHAGERLDLSPHMHMHMPTSHMHMSHAGERLDLSPHMPMPMPTSHIPHAHATCRRAARPLPSLLRRRLVRVGARPPGRSGARAANGRPKRGTRPEPHAATRPRARWWQRGGRRGGRRGAGRAPARTRRRLRVHRAAPAGHVGPTAAQDAHARLGGGVSSGGGHAHRRHQAPRLHRSLLWIRLGGGVHSARMRRLPQHTRALGPHLPHSCIASS